MVAKGVVMVWERDFWYTSVPLIHSTLKCDPIGLLQFQLKNVE